MDCSTPGFPDFTIFQNLLKLMSIESMMPSNHLILCHRLLLLPSIFPSIRVFFNESLFASDGQSIGASVSVLLINIYYSTIKQHQQKIQKTHTGVRGRWVVGVWIRSISEIPYIGSLLPATGTQLWTWKISMDSGPVGSEASREFSLPLSSCLHGKAWSRAGRTW